MDGCKTVGEGFDSCLYLGDGLFRWLASAVQIVPQLRLANAGDALQTGQAEGLAVLLEETGRIVVELVLNLLEGLPVALVVLTHTDVRFVEIVDGFLDVLPLADNAVGERCIIHIGGIAVGGFFNKYFHFLHNKLFVKGSLFQPRCLQDFT